MIWKSCSTKLILLWNWYTIRQTCVWPAISMPASRNSSKSWLNFPEATASWLLEPRVAVTTSPADWFRSAAVWLSSFWASWKDLLAGGIWTVHTREILMLNDKNLTAASTSVKLLKFVKIKWIFRRLTASIRSFLLASPMLFSAMSTSFWPGRQLTQLFREWETALATWDAHKVRTDKVYGGERRQLGQVKNNQKS